jgi:hypothetical protein
VWGQVLDIATGLGLLAGARVLATLIMLGGDMRMVAGMHAAIVILGGSFAATLIGFPLASIFHGLPLGAKFAFSLRRMTQGADRQVGGHGWFVTFADLMGLLASFFVMLVAFSTQDQAKLQMVAGSMRDVFGVQDRVRYSGIIEVLLHGGGRGGRMFNWP